MTTKLTEQVDKTTNYELLLAVDSDTLEDFAYLLAENGSFLLDEKNNLILA